MPTRTMVYRKFSDASNALNAHDNEHGKWEWQIVELEDGEGPPDGWQSAPSNAPYLFHEPATTAKPKRAKVKLPDTEPVTEQDTNGNSDGN